MRNCLLELLEEHQRRWGNSDDDVIHIGIDGESWDFFFGFTGAQALSFGDVLHRDGINTILSYFFQKIQSNKNILFGPGCIVKVYTYDGRRVVIPTNA